ncbi:MAG: hypothetical protein LBN33_03555 [Desulfovibrio sp.]|jgi:hypothetical protein|nr:hypothetical protein [Desulfovibrio sp.]
MIFHPKRASKTPSPASGNSPKNKTLLFACLLLTAALLAAACGAPKQPPLPLGSLKLGLASFTQPAVASDMLAGYQPEGTPKIDAKDLNELDSIFNQVLSKESKHSFTGRESSDHCRRTVGAQEGRSNTQAALRTWSAVGRCMGVDLLVVPQALEFRQRDGGSFGVVSPARVVMDTFIIDTRNEALISRSRFDETQSNLSSNLLDTGKFLKRGGQWISAQELAREGMEKAVKELGL